MINKEYFGGLCLGCLKVLKVKRNFGRFRVITYLLEDEIAYMVRV